MEKDLFKEVMRTIASRLSETDYTLWLKDLLFEDFNDGVLTLITNSLIRKERIEKRYLDFIKKVAVEHYADLHEVRIIHLRQQSGATSQKLKKAGDESSTTAVSSQPAPAHNIGDGKARPQEKASFHARESSSAQLIPGVLHEHVFGKFLVVKENELVYNFAKKAVRQFGKNSPLYFYGPVGVGKTHLLQAVANEVKKSFPFYKIRYVTPDKFIQEFTASIFAKTDRGFRQRYQSTDLLIIDDVQFFGGKHKSSIEFFHIFNAIYAPGKQMIFASDCPPAELDAFDLRLKSRLSSSIIVSVPELAQASRQRLLAFFAQQQKLVLKEDVLAFLATMLPGNVREIKGAITTLRETLVIYEEQSRRLEPDEAFCREILKDRFVVSSSNQASPHIFSVDAILKEVCRTGDISLKELRSPKKTKHLARMRKYATYLLKKHTHLSISEIGGYLGGKTPSAISYNLKDIEKKLSDSDPGMHSFFSKVEEKMLALVSS